MKSKLSQKLLAGILSVAILLNMGITPVFATTEGALPIGTSRVCTHHIHDDKCGYTEGTLCTHEHTDECSAEVKNCVHEHTAECYPAQDSGEATGGDATGGDAKEPTACTHICDEKSGCITKELACKHVHDNACGYKEGKPCTFDTATCESCKTENTADNRATLAGEVYAVYDGSKFCAATQADQTTPTTTEIADKNTITNLYVTGASAPDNLIGDSNAANKNTNLKTVTCANTVITIGKQAFKNCTALTSVTMPNVTTIGQEAFKGCANLTSVTMPNAITIDNSAFENCVALASANMPKATTIGNSAFNACVALKSLTLGATPPTTVGTEAFLYCPTPRTLTIQGNTANSEAVLAAYTTAAASDGNADNKWYGWTLPNTISESYAVYDGSKFCAATAESPKVPTTTEITDKKTINHLYIMGASVPANLMSDCTNLKTVICANTVTTIGNEAFSDCSALASVEMPKATSISDSGFWGCTKLASLTLGATPPATVGADAFYGCPTSTLTIQGNPAFKDTVLAAYKAAADGNVTDNLWWDWTLPISLDGTGVSNSAGTLAVTIGNSNPTFGAENTITLTATFDKAAKSGKQRALAINEVEFKDGETSLGTVAATPNADGKWVATLDVNTKDWTVGAHNLTATFAGNHELGGSSTTNEVTVTVNESYAVYDGITFYRATQAAPSTATEEKITDKNTINHLYIMGASVPEELMLSCTNLKTVICANTVTTIGNFAFMDCTSLTSVNMPAVITIGTSAFSGCEGLASVNMPKATSIGNGAFSDCAKLASVNMPKATSIGVQAFATCKALKSVEMSEATSIGNEAFLSCTKLASVAMPSATSIGENAFGYCTGLTSVAMPKVTTIGANAFSNCTSLTSVEMPSATTIGKFAFNSCEKLASVEMPKVTTIDNQAFNRCAALTSLTLDATPPATVGTDVFKKCPTPRTLTIQGNPVFQTEVIAAYKAVNDGGITDNLWWDWTLPTALDGSGVSNSAGTLAVTTGNAAPIFGTDNAITLTATFDKAAKIGKQRTLAINKVEFKDGANTLGAIATATQNTDGKWVAILNVNTKDWALGEHKLTAEYAGNHELGGATANVTLTISIDVSLITASITAANNTKGGIAIYDTAASSVANGTKFVTTVEMTTLNTAIQTATAAKATCATLAQVQAAVKALDDAVADFKAAIKTGTYTAPVTPPVPDDGGSTGGGSTGGSSSDNDSDSGSSGTVAPPPTTTTPTNPNPPTTGEIKAPATVDNNGNASITVTDQTVADAIKKAQDEAKKNGTEKNGVSVELKVDTGKKAPNSISANLPKAVQDSLVEGKVSEFKIASEAANLTFDSKTLQEIQKQAGGDATINASKADVSKLSKEAQNEIGDRPVFNLSITGKDGKNISDFGGGSATVSIPYTLQPNENPNNLQAFFVDAKGELHEVTCTYDPVTKCMVFVTNHFSTYGIGYKENAPKFNDIEKHWAKNDIEFVTARGLLAGTDKATFSPDSTITRKDFAAALTKLSRKDVSKIIKSSDKAEPITRQEMAEILLQFTKGAGYNLPQTRGEMKFSDTKNAAVKSMQMAGVIMGKNGNRFDPTATATRAEASAVLRRYVELIIDKTTAQGLDMNDSGKIVYYENGKLFTGTKNIDGKTYRFGNDGICVKIDAVIPDTKKYVIHKIVRGDTLWDIALKNKCTISEIVGLNGIKNPNNVPIGTELKIPQK